MLHRQLKITTTSTLRTTDYTVNPSIQPTYALSNVIASTVRISNIPPLLTVSINSLTSHPTMSPSPSPLPIEIAALQQSINYYVEDGDPAPLLVSLNNADFVQK